MNFICEIKDKFGWEDKYVDDPWANKDDIEIERQEKLRLEEKYEN